MIVSIVFKALIEFEKDHDFIPKKLILNLGKVYRYLVTTKGW